MVESHAYICEDWWRFGSNAYMCNEKRVGWMLVNGRGMWDMVWNMLTNELAMINKFGSLLGDSKIKLAIVQTLK